MARDTITADHEAAVPLPGSSGPLAGGTPRLSLRTNFSWTFVATIVYTASLWVMMVLVAKLGVPADLGQWTIAQAVCAPVLLLTSLNLRAAMMTDAADQFTYGQYLGLRMLLAAVGVLIIAALAVGQGYSGTTLGVIILTGVGSAIIAFREILQGVCLKNERMDYPARSQILLALLSVAGFALVYVPTRSLIVALLALIPIRLMVLLVYDLRHARMVAAEHPGGAKARSLRPDVSYRMMRDLVITTLPLGLAMTLSSLNNSFPVYFLEAYSGETATGFYGANAAIMGAALVVGNTLGSTVSPRLASYYLTNRRAFRSLLFRVLAVGVAAGVGLLLFAVVLGKPFLAVMFKPEYADYSSEFVVMMGATGLMFLVSFLMYGLVAARALRGMLAGFVVVAGASAALSWRLIPEQGVMGAAFVRLLTGGLALLVLALVLGVKMRLDGKLPSPADKTMEKPV